MPDIYIILFLISAGLICIGILLYSTFHFESAVFLLLLSPWIPGAFYLSNPEKTYLQEAGPGSYLRVILLILLCVIGILNYWKYISANSRKAIPGQYYFILGFLVLAFASAYYSIDKPITLIRAATFLFLFGFLLGLHAWLRTKKEMDQLINVVFIFCAAFIIIDLLWWLFIPSKAWSQHLLGRLIGVWGHPNTLGAFCMCSFPVMLFKLADAAAWKKTFIIFLLTMNTIMLVFAGSRTSLFGSLMIITTWLFFQRKYVSMFFSLSAVTVAVLLLMGLQLKSLERGENDNLITGRDEFWRGTMTLIMERPAFGYGYSIEGKIWEDPRFFKKEYELWSGSSRTSIHNGYLSVTIGVGIIGLVLWIFILIVPLITAMKAPDSPYKSFILSTMIVILVSNFFESTLNAANTLGTIMYWISWALAAKLNVLK